MITLDTHLTSLVTRGVISGDEAVEYAQNTDEMRKRLTEFGVQLTPV